MGMDACDSKARKQTSEEGQRQSLKPFTNSHADKGVGGGGGGFELGMLEEADKD